MWIATGDDRSLNLLLAPASKPVQAPHSGNFLQSLRLSRGRRAFFCSHRLKNHTGCFALFYQNRTRTLESRVRPGWPLIPHRTAAALSWTLHSSLGIAHKPPKMHTAVLGHARHV